MKKLLNFLYWRFDLPLKLGSGYYNKIKFIFASWLLFFKYKFGIPKKIDEKITIKVLTRNYDIYLNNRTDLDVLRDIIANNEYKFDYRIKPEVIFDLGANKGMATIYFNAMFPDAKIYSVEPLPFNFSCLKKNIGGIKNAIPFNLAISGRNGVNDFYIFDEDKHQSSSLILRQEGQSHLKVECKTIDTIMAENNLKKIDILKFDIEGAEYDVFREFKNIEKVKYLIGEVHPTIFKKSLEDFLALFPDFELMLMKPQNYVVVLKNKKI